MTTRFGLTLLVALVVLCPSVRAEAPDPDPGRFAVSIGAFVNWDSKNSVPVDGILFVGSSSIRLWPTAMAFPGRPVINRGFGGSELSDVIHYYPQLIRPHAPGMIVLYAGENDIAGGKAADQVLADLAQLAGMLRADFPETELVFISIKPSKLRWALWPTMLEANRLVREYTAKHANMKYADLATTLLGDDGNPKDVYVEDGLHLNAEGYRLWQEALAPFLDSP